MLQKAEAYVQDLWDDFNSQLSFMEDGVFDSKLHRVTCVNALLEMRDELEDIGETVMSEDELLEKVGGL